MPADRLLGTLLRSLQTWTDQQDTSRLLGTASSLLTTLNNPLNVTLLTSQLLSAPALWERPEGLRTCMRFLSVFHSAVQALIRHETAVRDKTSDQEFDELQFERTLPKDDWIRAIISGADDHSPRWRHTLVFAGLLIAYGPLEDDHLSYSMRNTLQTALTTATNIALRKELDDDELAQESITVVLNHCFPLLSDLERERLDYDRLLPILTRSTLHSHEGLRSAYFLGAIEIDVQETPEGKLHWPERSSSYQQMHIVQSSPLISSLGPLARLIGHSIENVSQSHLVIATLNGLEDFTRTLCAQWRRSRLSSVDAPQEHARLSSETRDRTNSNLWKLLRSVLFGTVIMLRSIVGRMLGDKALANDKGESSVRMM